MVLGDEIFSVMVHLERWERIDDGGAMQPPQLRPEEGEIDEDDADNNILHGGDEEQAEVDDKMEGGGEVENVVAPRQNRPLLQRNVQVRAGAGAFRSWKRRATLAGRAERDEGGLAVAGGATTVGQATDGSGRPGDSGRRSRKWRVVAAGGADQDEGGPSKRGSRRWEAQDTKGASKVLGGEGADRDEGRPARGNTGYR